MKCPEFVEVQGKLVVAGLGAYDGRHCLKGDQR